MKMINIAYAIAIQKKYMHGLIMLQLDIFKSKSNDFLK